MSTFDEKEIDKIFWLKDSIFAISYIILIDGGEDEIRCLCIMDIETNEIYYNMIGKFVQMQPLAIHHKSQEVRYLLVQ